MTTNQYRCFTETQHIPRLRKGLGNVVAKPTIVGTIHQVDGSTTLVLLKEKHGRPRAHRNPNGHKNGKGFLLACPRTIVFQNNYATKFVEEDGTPLKPKCTSGRKRGLKDMVLTDQPVVGVTRPMGVPRVIVHRYTISVKNGTPNIRATLLGQGSSLLLPPHLATYVQAASELEAAFPEPQEHARPPL